mmetsp:Transcript_21569/g.31365  ORF Transcript_21569/g.31365 Transcript_21569/m.31365 type:complete len:260 (+) Transcript_21569:89-868(+)
MEIVDVTTLDQLMSDTRNAVTALSSDIAELKQVQSDQSDRIEIRLDRMQNQLDRIELLLSELHKRPVQDETSNTITPARSHIVSPWNPPSMKQVPITPIPGQCLQMLNSCSGISSASVFFHWYVSDLKDLHTATFSDNEKKIFNMYRRMVNAMLHFIGPDIVIPEKPNKSNVEEYDKWTRTIRDFADKASTNILHIRNELKNKEYEAAINSGPPTKKIRRHPVKDNVTTNDDFLRKKVRVEGYPYSRAVDNLTPTWNKL